MKIKLGKLPNTVSVKITITIPRELKEKLDRYAELHSTTWTELVVVDQIIPHILSQFIGNDRAFRQLERRSKLLSKHRHLDT